MDNTNEKKGLIGLVVILSVLVVGLSSYLIYDKALEKDVIDKEGNTGTATNEENTGTDEENAKIDEEDIEISEETKLITNFEEQIRDLEYLDNISIDNGNYTIKNGWFYELDKLLISEMESDILLMYEVNRQAGKIFDTSISKELLNEHGELLYTYKIIGYDDLNSILMSSGYIKDEKILTNLEKIDSCPQLLYNSEYDAYVITGSCGYVNNLETYNYKIEKDDATSDYYIYRSVAYIDIYNQKIDYTNITKLVDKEINQDNYNNYSKYKFTFKNNYLYSVERIK